MPNVWGGFAVALALISCLFAACASGDSSGSGDEASGDDDAADDTDDDLADDDADDDTWPPLPDDDVADDDSFADDFVAPWPQSNVEPRDYDESGDAGPLREKAADYDDWHVAWHQPDHGGTVGVTFTDETRTTLAGYRDWGDSSEWTGLYLGSQATRWYVTGDDEAKENALRTVAALDGYLRVTQTPGFLARYWGSQSSALYQGDDWCDANSGCRRVESGPFAGDFWWGETSRDMYSGWFFGMSLAFDLLDDEDARATIRDDVTDILDTLIAQRWMILDEEGEPTDYAPDVLPPFRISWLTVGYHITGEERFKVELQKWLRNRSRGALRASTISVFNRYMDYFGNCLSHETWYNLLRLGKVYFSPDDYAFLQDVFNTQVHSFTRLSHNPWFNAVFMGQGGYVPARDDPYQAQLVEDLTDFWDAPHARYFLVARDPSTYDLDPVSVLLHDLVTAIPLLGELLGNVSPQAKDPFPVREQCPADFMFQWSPFTIDACGEDSPEKVDPGVDYLIPYWLSSYHKFLAKDE
ncbi:MAG: hypothetical protein KJ042_01465 [Deltaproteobacteria bacterium]|nr:hypothetical protein [Deltaproteobacteria bacterium]